MSFIPRTARIVAHAFSSDPVAQADDFQDELFVRRGPLLLQRRGFLPDHLFQVIDEVGVTDLVIGLSAT